MLRNLKFTCPFQIGKRRVLVKHELVVSSLDSIMMSCNWRRHWLLVVIHKHSLVNIIIWCRKSHNLCNKLKTSVLGCCWGLISNTLNMERSNIKSNTQSLGLAQNDCNPPNWIVVLGAWPEPPLVLPTDPGTIKYWFLTWKFTQKKTRVWMVKGTCCFSRSWISRTKCWFFLYLFILNVKQG